MNKKILIGVILSCFLLLVTPCINAVEYKEVKEEVKNQIESKISSLMTSEFKTVILLDVLLLVYFVLFLFWFYILLTTTHPDGTRLLSFIESIIYASINAIYYMILGIYFIYNFITGLIYLIFAQPMKNIPL